jgi:hypothetical protein
MNKGNAASKAFSSSSKSIFWGGPAAKVPRYFVKDRKWCLQYRHENASGVTINFKVGNNISALDAQPRGQSAASMVSEQGLYRKYRYENK